MQIRIFNIPLTDSGEALTEMNRFLSGHKVLEVEQRFFQNEKGGCWSFCVRTLPDATGTGAGTAANGGRAKKDYKLLLPEEQFAVFSRLREIRKVLAAEDGVPAYAVFTDEELSNIARLEELTEKGLASIGGIGEKKIERYGRPMLEQYHAAPVNPEGGNNFNTHTS